MGWAQTRSPALPPIAADMLHPLDISDETGTQMFPDGKRGHCAVNHQDADSGINRGRSLAGTRLPECGEFRGPGSGRRPGAHSSGLDGGVGENTTGLMAMRTRSNQNRSRSHTRAPGKTYRIKARSVVMAGGSWTTRPHCARALSRPGGGNTASFIARRA